MLRSSSGARVRKARQTDAKALAELFRVTWRQAYTGIIPHRHLESLIRHRGTDWWPDAIRNGDDLLVLEVQRKVAGYATLGPSRERGSRRGEIYELYIDPTHQGLGFGEHLFEACRSRVDQRLLSGLVVWALADNTAATAFYWRRGGRPVRSAYDNIGGVRLEKIAFTWE